MNHRLTFLWSLLFAVVVATPGAEVLVPAGTKATAPSQAEWTPVQQALDSQAPDAQAQLTALLRTYPTWADGNKALARLLIDQGKSAEALAAAKRANQLAPDDVEALRIQVRALADLQRKAEVTALMTTAAAKDTKGWLHYEAGLAAVSFGDGASAETYLKAAKSRGGAKVPAEFLFLDSRVAILARDYPRAELALGSATTQQPDFWDGWYELGRVRLVLADTAPEGQRGDWIKKATDAFAVVAKNVPADVNSRIGLGRAALEQAKLLVAQGNEDQAGASLREAIAYLNQAIALNAELTEAYILLGDAQLRLEQWPAAATALERAQQLGAKDRNLTFNLAIAWQQTGKQAEADALLKTVTAASPAEQVTIGLGAYRSKNWLLAANLLSSAVDKLDDHDAKAATWRVIGHAHSALAQAKTAKPEDQERERDAASAAYKQAGDLTDFPARRFYLATEAARSPERAYAAAWQAISWDSLNLGAWGLAVANYGAAKTSGQGIGGMASRAPLHLAAWGLLTVIPLGLFAWGLLRRKPETVSGDGRRGAPKPRTAGSKPGSGKVTGPPPAAHPSGKGSGPRPPRPPSRPPVSEKSDTESLERPAASRVPDPKAETMMIPVTPPKPGTGGKPQVKPLVRRPSQVDIPEFPTPGPDGGGGALERRKK